MLKIKVSQNSIFFYSKTLYVLPIQKRKDKPKPPGNFSVECPSIGLDERELF